MKGNNKVYIYKWSSGTIRAFCGLFCAFLKMICAPCWLRRNIGNAGPFHHIYKHPAPYMAADLYPQPAYNPHTGNPYTYGFLQRKPRKKSHNVHYVKLCMANTVLCGHSAHKKGVQDQIIREKGAGQGISGSAGSGRVAPLSTRQIKKGPLRPTIMHILLFYIFILIGILYISHNGSYKYSYRQEYSSVDYVLLTE